MGRRAIGMALVGGVAVVLATVSPSAAATGWQPVPSPNPAGSTYTQLNAVFTVSASRAWAVGQTRVAASGDGFEATIERWNGSAWKVVTGAPVSASASTVNGVSGSGPHDVWAVGANADSSLIEHWNGQTWQQVTVANEPADAQLAAVSVDSPTDAWAGGWAMKTNPHNSGVTPVLEHWNGSQWTVVPGAIDTTNSADSGRILSIAAISPTDAWAIAAVGKHNPASLEHWNGTTWATVALPVTTTLHGLSAIAANDVWAVGDDGVTLNYNGSSWTQVANPAGQQADLAGVTALTAHDVQVVSIDGNVTEQWNGSQWVATSTAQPPPPGFRVAGGFIWSGGAVSGHLGAPAFAVGGAGNNTTILEQPSP
jgi:hypothetical protein